MFLKRLQLNNFRNYATLSFDFNTPITILIGNNAQGKTNFLESIYCLATAKSPKAEKDEELIRWGTEVMRIEGQLSDETSLEVAMQISEHGFKKRVKVNGLPRRVSEYSENLAVVFFAPEDINLVTGSPSLRRDYIDKVLSQVDRNYKKASAAYENIITRKNKVLKRIREGFAKKEELYYWSSQQVHFGNLIQEKRHAFFVYINSLEKDFGLFEYQFIPNSISEERLQEYASKEIDAASSLIGPHRDDFNFLLEKSDLSKFGSRGEQRTAVLDLKLAEVSFIEETLKRRPLLLLDDIFSELDISHQEHVMKMANLQQTVIAAVEIDAELKQYLTKEVKVLTVEKGQLAAATIF